jgi:molybdenum cofactor cytidylyltransferase
MKFGPLEIARAEGAILAHSTRTSSRTLKKGRILDADDVALLREAGYETVIAAELEAGDVAEDVAAERLAQAVLGSGCRSSEPFTGRCNLFAETEGLLVVDVERLNQINFVSEELTVATLPPFTPVFARQMVATIKIIPFSAGESALEQCEAVARALNDGVVHVAPLRGRPVGLVQTRLPGTKESVLDKASRVLANRLENLGSWIAIERRCDHTAEAVGEAVVAELDSGCEMVLIAGASAIVDRRDVVPEGIERAGGSIEHFGMPVDPGNLLLLARHGDIPVLGLPGCARSPKPSGFDYVLQRLSADLPVTPRDIMAMGPLGLLKEFAGRPSPRASRDEDKAPAREARIAAVVLAAGQSRRMGERNKLLEEVDDAPMVLHAVRAARASSAEQVIVVTGHERERVESLLADEDVVFAHNPGYAEGLSTSLATGVGAVAEGIEGVVVCLGDMPRVSARHLNRLIAAFDPVEGRSICLATRHGKRGNPVLFAARYFPEIQDIRGDVGARHLVGSYEEQVCEVEMDDDAVLIDVDSPHALRAIRHQGGEPIVEP